MKGKLLIAGVMTLLLGVVIACTAPAPAVAPQPPAPVAATAAPPAPTSAPPSAQPAPIALANAFVAAMNRRAVEEALAMFTDDTEYVVAVQTSKGKAQVRTFFEYMDAIRMRVAQSDCKMEGEQVICSQRRQDDSMSAYGFNDVRFKFTYSFKDGKIQKAIGAADGPQWPAYSAMSKEAMAWMTANRAEEWKTISTPEGVLVRTGQTSPTVMKLAREYAKAKQVAPTPTDLVGLANAYVAARKLWPGWPPVAPRRGRRFPPLKVG